MERRVRSYLSLYRHVDFLRIEAKQISSGVRQLLSCIMTSSEFRPLFSDITTTVLPWDDMEPDKSLISRSLPPMAGTKGLRNVNIQKNCTCQWETVHPPAT